MEPTFGARLRQQREERQVTLTTIATKTKIKMSLLEALESDDFSFWPKGLFGRAYLRDYATAIGLDPEAVVSEFLSLYPEFSYVTPQVEEAEAAARAEAARSGPAQRFRRLVNSALSVMPLRSQASASSDHAVERRRYDESADVDSEVVSASFEPALAEAEERIAIGEERLSFGESMPIVSPAPEFGAFETRLQEFEEFEAQRREPEMSPSPFHHEPEVREGPPVQPAYAAFRPVRHTAEAQEPAQDISLSAVAEVCTRLARALDWREVTTLLADAARLIDAVGIIVWQWDAHATALRPSLACGYPETVMARIPPVRTDDANAVATAFRSGERCVVDSPDGEPEAVVVPSLGTAGCVGVLALELRPGTRKREAICAVASIIAAQLAVLLPSPEPVEA